MKVLASCYSACRLVSQYANGMWPTFNIKVVQLCTMFNIFFNVETMFIGKCCKKVNKLLEKNVAISMFSSTKFKVIQNWSIMLIHPWINIEMMARKVLPCIITWSGWRWDFLLITNRFWSLTLQITILFQMSSLHIHLNIFFCALRGEKLNDYLNLGVKIPLNMLR